MMPARQVEETVSLAYQSDAYWVSRTGDQGAVSQL